MKKVLSVMMCGLLAACACDENQWEEVDVVSSDEVVYVEPTPVVEPSPVYVQQEPTRVSDCPCSKNRVAPVVVPTPAPCTQPAPCVQSTPCFQPTCYQPCGCNVIPQPAPQPKVVTTKKIITTTTTVQEPCGKPVCEPVVTTHEEIVPAEVSYSTNYSANNGYTPSNDVVSVTVESNPYHSKVVGMSSAAAKVNPSVAAKYTPEAYGVVATRATNRMLQDTSAIYDNGRTKTVYLKDTKLLSSDLPYGSHRLKGTTKEIINGSRTYDVVNNPANADFIIETAADWYVANNAAPALQYKLSMFDKNGKKVNEWVEIIRQVQD